MLEEAARDVGRRDFAAWLRGEDVFASARDGVVDRVAPRAGHGHEDGEEGPGEAEAAHDAERGVGSDVEGIGVEENERIGEGRGRVVLGEESRGRGGMEWGEAEAGAWVSPDDEADGGGAEGAVTVEEDDGMGRWLCAVRGWHRVPRTVRGRAAHSARRGSWVRGW